MCLYHYYDKRSGPFNSLTALETEEAERVLGEIKRSRPGSQCAKRDPLYVSHRRNCEAMLRREFEKKSGLILRDSPHYMVVEHSPWLSTWFEDCRVVKIPVEEFDLRTLSFTYGDSMPTFSSAINDGKEYRHQLYTYWEILEVIEKYGLPQSWNDDGSHGPERYVEVHVWSDDTINKYKHMIQLRAEERRSQ